MKVPDQPALAHLLTETRNPASEHLDELSTLQMLEVINDEDAKVAAAVRAELPNIALTASLFGPETLFDAPISESLRAALEAIEGRLLFVARPEMFTDGATLEWLTARCEGIADHLHKGCTGSGHRQEKEQKLHLHRR